MNVDKARRRVVSSFACFKNIINKFETGDYDKRHLDFILKDMKKVRKDFTDGLVKIRSDYDFIMMRESENSFEREAYFEVGGDSILDKFCHLVEEDDITGSGFEMKIEEMYCVPVYTMRWFRLGYV